jgi:CarboxypepD_reg-like domain
MIQGTVIDSGSGETLPGANVYFSDSDGSPGSATGGIGADSNGHYLFPNYTQQKSLISTQFPSAYITASFTGYKRQTMEAKEGIVNFSLDPDVTNLPEVEIIGQRNSDAAITPVSVNQNLFIYIAGGVLAIVSLYLILRNRNDK